MMTENTTTTTSVQPSGRTLIKELFIAAAPERVYRAFTERAELERWFVTFADVDENLQPGGRYTLHWQQDVVPGDIVVAEPPQRFVFHWDGGERTGITTCAVEFLPQSDGTLLRLTHSGWGSGDDWDSSYDGTDSGWSEELARLKAWLEDGTPKDWSTIPVSQADAPA